MSSAISELLGCGVTKAVIVGTDIPGIKPEVLSSSLSALDTYDVVLGPAADGGYYLIGSNRPLGEMLKGIPWSTGEVYGETVRRAEAAGLRVAPRALLPELDDVDYAEDLVRAAGRLSPAEAAEVFGAVFAGIVEGLVEGGSRPAVADGSP
mmetsp:Transcript_43295/g.102719  ORF Transcript_43295/g.102719 Transcript_43295/m.102719 type:complete len:151 (-) Transcript_43295:29-481(-)